MGEGEQQNKAAPGGIPGKDRGTSAPSSGNTASFHLADGIFLPAVPVRHDEQEYPSRGFALLRRMQQRHFWYRGRHRFVLHAVRRRLRRKQPCAALRVVDMGCGCGAWIADCMSDLELRGAEWAAADSSLTSLRHARQVLPGSVDLYQVDLLRLDWRNRWDIVFLLDVLEHLEDDARALRQIAQAISPGGLLFLTVPALRCFWTWNDEMAGHKRRYSKASLGALAADVGLAARDLRYFMFFLSPLLLASRWLTSHRVKGQAGQSAERVQEALHRVPHPMVNLILKSVFFAETPLGHYLPFPWGTSLLGVFEKPLEARRQAP